MVKKTQENFKCKIDRLKSAAKDDLFLDGLREISEDFRPIDSEGWDF